MGRRTLLLIASILIAAVGTALIGLYVRGADNRAQQTEGMVSALVATQTITAGTNLETAVQSMRVASVPGRMAETGAYRNPNAFVNIQKALKNKVVIDKIEAEQVVLASMFGDAGEAANTEIKNGFGVSVELTDPGRAAGLLAPGSHVKIYLIPTNGDKDLEQVQNIDIDQRKTGPTAGKMTLAPELKLPVILPDAVVMRIGNSSSTTTTTTTRNNSSTQKDDVPRTIITLDVDEAGADRLVLAEALGDLYFAVIGKP
jgi:pilus assembly protein CpaB